jgi:uncharacterized membrane protein (UPF0127 family)
MRKLLSLILLFALFSCQSESQDPLKKTILKTAGGDSIKTTLAYTSIDSERGLSGVKSEDYADDQGMLFFYLSDEERHFWMPDTYFDLDLFYLDKDLKVLDIIRKLPFYIGRANPESIPRARGVWCRHVLEMKSGSSIAEKIKVGDQLGWESSKSLQETEQMIRDALLK